MEKKGNKKKRNFYIHKKKMRKAEIKGKKKEGKRGEKKRGITTNNPKKYYIK